MSEGIIPQGWYTNSDYFGWIGEYAHSDPIRKQLRKKGYYIRNDKAYQKFESENAYLEWWQDRFS